VQPVYRGPLVGDLGGVAVGVVDAAGAGFGEWVQDRVELGADSRAESAFQVPHAVAALFQLHTAAALLLLIINGFWAVGIGGIHYCCGEAA
jgi:hypothetical protein